MGHGRRPGRSVGASSVEHTGIPDAGSLCVSGFSERRLTQFLSPAKRFLLKLAHYARYGPVGLDDPQEEVEVWLRGPGEPKGRYAQQRHRRAPPVHDRSDAPSERGTAAGGQPFRLTMHDRRSPQRLLGVIHMHLVRTIDLGDHRFCLFEVDGSENLSVPAGSASVFTIYRNSGTPGSRRRKNPYNFQMNPRDLRGSHVFYICPRPVVLVSVEHEGSANLFSMDLIGPTDSPWFSMALRSTSPAVRLMQQSRRMALAGAPFAYRDIAYELGKHHRLPSIDWATLPFKTTRSAAVQPPGAGRGAPRSRGERPGIPPGGLACVVPDFGGKEDTVPAGVRGPQLFHAFGAYR